MSSVRQDVFGRKHCRFAALLLAFTALSLPGAAGAGGLNQFIGFGDSTMDSGYFRYGATGGSPGLPSPYQFSNVIDKAIAVTVAAGGTGAFLGPGIVDTVQLAAKFGLTAYPVTMPGGLGTNYANGSAQTVPTTWANGYINGLYNNVPIVTQISNYLVTVNNVANPNALYMISFGGNDLTWLENQGGGVSSPAYITSLARALSGGIANLQAAGAQTIVVLNVYSYARVVGANGSLNAADRLNISDAASYSAQVWSGLQAAHVNFVPADIEGLLRTVSQNPTPFGFTPATVLSSNTACTTSSALVCAPAQLITPNAEQTYLWSDSHHVTTAGQAIEADYIYSLMAAPSQVSLLAESPVQGGLARAATIQGQIDLSAQHRGPTRVNVWASAGASNLNFKGATTYPSDSGTPFGGSVGTDYQLQNGLILGMAVTAGAQTQNFTGGTGHFDQTDQALSLYAAYRMGPLWGNAIASYGLLQEHVARQVTLNTYTDHNNANTSGNTVALALRGGHDFQWGAVTTGPVLGFVMQYVHIDGFVENGATGMTALKFGGQSRSSYVSQLGWRGSMDLGKWQPFAEVAWNHDFAGRNRLVTATLTSIAAPTWSSPASPIATDWASAQIGTAYKFSPQATLRAGLSAVVINPRVNSFGGQIGLNVSF